MGLKNYHIINVLYKYNLTISHGKIKIGISLIIIKSIERIVI